MVSNVIQIAKSWKIRHGSDKTTSKSVMNVLFGHQNLQI